MPRPLPNPALYVEKNDAGDLVLRSRDQHPPSVRLAALGIEEGATFYVVRPADLRALVGAASMAHLAPGRN